MRKNFEMTEDQLKTLLHAMRPIQAIMTQSGDPLSLQERSNNAWKQLGTELGFNHMTVIPTGKGSRFFSAHVLKAAV